MTAEFTGFSPEAIQFLVDLAANNERPWFQARKTDYERLLKEPLEALCADVAVEFVKRGVPLQSDPKRPPFRIYRDVRFSKDKSPYKTHIAANFPWRGDGADDAPTWGGGYFHPSPSLSRTLQRRDNYASTSSRARSTSAAACGTRSQPGWPPGGMQLIGIPAASTMRLTIRAS